MAVLWPLEASRTSIIVARSRPTDSPKATASLVAAIRSARAAGADALPPFRALQDLLDDHRARHSAALEKLRADADALPAERDQAAIAPDRTWAFPLYPTAALDALAADLRGAFA